MASRLSGRAKTVAEEICHLTRSRIAHYPSARQQRKRLGQLITELAGFPIEPQRMVGNVPGWVVDAVYGRRNEHMSSLARHTA